MVRAYRKGTYEGLPCRYGHGATRYHAGGACIVCSKEKSKQRWENGTKKPAKYDPMYRREQQLKKEYGITHEDYEYMAADQGYGCAICGGEPKGRYFHVDHCHKTGKVRGLLCYTCNIGLGSFHDSPEKLRQAIAYLNRHQI